MSKRLLLSLLTVCIASITLANPAYADDAEDVGLTLLSSQKIDWIAGSSEWLHLTWTVSEDIQNVQVRVTEHSKGMSVEYPDGAKFTSLMVDENLSSNEIDFTAIKVTTDPALSGETQEAKIEITWEQKGERFEAEGELKFSNQRYRGEDFAILTEEVTITTDVTTPEQNWVEFGYKGIAPTTRDMQISVSGELAAYHPQGRFTSLHHDQTLHGGEVDVARVWFDPELVDEGSYTIAVTISYTNSRGRSKSIDHKVLVSVVGPR